MPVLLLLTFVTGMLAAPKPVDFLREVRPILSDACFQCHGPDETTRMAKLRLDQKESAVPKASMILERVTETRGPRKMPPRHAKVQLSESQVATLKRWVQEGAPWQEHWSYVAPKKLAPPSSAAKKWAKGAIDQFVLARLEQDKLAPSAEADRTTLLRRLSLDLTGLPPTPAELDAFLTDRSPQAYEKQVDRLLASPRYGEKMALHWLDLARYADTHGYHIDSHRDMWPWRDWVIGAFNRNMRYDQFTVWQLAGDLLPNATREQKLASGFNRNHVINYEGGAIPEEYQTEYVIDRVETTGTAWLGLTVGCARCHDHKYDPIQQKDFYRMFAFFNNIAEKGLDGQKGNAAPVLKLPNELQATLEREMEEAIAGREKQMKEADVPGKMLEWEKGRLEQLAAPARAELLAHYEMEGNFNEATGTYRHGRYLGQPPAGNGGAVGQSAVLDAPARIEVPMPEALDGNKPFSIAFWFRGGNKLEPMTIWTQRTNGAGIEVGNDEVYSIGDLRRGAHLLVTLTDARGARRVYESLEAFPYNEFTHFVLNHQGEGRFALLLNGKPAAMRESGSQERIAFANRGPMVFEQMIGSLDELRIYGRVLSESEAHQLAVVEPVRYLLFHSGINRDKAQMDLLREYYLTYDAPEELKALHKRLKQLKAERKQLEEQVPSAMVMSELDRPRESYLLRRGQYDQKGEKVEAGTPGFLPPMPAELPRNRLGLAQWLTAKDHPLTARVAVNRAWAMFFGTGLVKTVEDFGSQGELPSHPELLDWMAVDFVESGWDLKRLNKEIVMSATYRQSSAMRPELKEKDPENRLLARMSRFRLQAELVRDNALAVSGLLHPEIGGKSVSPYQPPGLWEEVAYGAQFSAQRYVQSTGKDLYRRGMYSFWKRTLPPAGLAIFDAPDREKCVARRAVTNTPLQALALMNDVTYLEAARKLAERTLKEGGAEEQKRLRYLFRLATSRYPDANELKLLTASVKEMKARYGANPLAAAKLIQVGESKVEHRNAVELAAWMSVASAVLNLDEVVTKE
ncbi:MAG: DUF1553 domain-containing protein [Acidobacteriota bacterium]